MTRRLLLFAVTLVFGVALAAPSAQAAFGIADWQVVTCSENEDTPEPGNPPVSGLPPLGQAANQCTAEPASESRWFKQAAGHPNFAITDFTLNTYPAPEGSIGFPEGFVKDIVVETPEGLSVNPEAAPQCTVKQLEGSECPAASQVGVNYLTISAASPPAPNCEPKPPGKCAQARVALPVYNLVPFQGAPSMVGFQTPFLHEVFIVGSLDPKDQHVTFTISDIDPPSAESPPIIGSRLVFNGRAGNGTYLTLPSNCVGTHTATLRVDQLAAPGAYVSQPVTLPYSGEGCAAVPFKPTIDVRPHGGAVDSPEATTVDLGIPFDPTAPIANSYLKTAKVTLPAGMGLNPASAKGLVACTDAQFGKGTNNPIACPPASRIGSVEVQTPSLPADSLTGSVYVGQPHSNNPSSGEQFRIFIYVGSARFGVNVRLVGNVFPNLQTGQLTAVVDENPQATFSSFKLRLNGGSKGTLTSPPTCGPNPTTTEMTPWSGNPDQNKPTSSFVLSTLPEGGACPPTLAARPFAPSTSARSDNSGAGVYSPFRLRVARSDGEQELKAVDVTLPKGLSAKLAGIPYCGEANLAAATTSSGLAQRAGYSCPAASQIGTTTAAAGSGNGPIKLPGKAFLAGPYKGAPLSMAIITPGVAGPYDVGTVVVRVALHVNPTNVRVHAVSDLIPNVFGGVKLDIRGIDVDLDRDGFMRNPTNCGAQSTVGRLIGGGANPADPAAFSAFAVDDRYSATDCNRRSFKPKLFTRLTGPTRRAKNPRLRAVLQAREADANIRRVALTLPHSLFLDQSHIRTVCTRVRLAARNCPKGAVYGHAKAVTPLLAEPLRGPVYLVSSNDKLPNLVADLRGQVDVQLRGVISSKRGGLKTVFRAVPDVPVKTFILNMRGGKKSLLVNSTNTCKGKQTAVLNIKGQNGKRVKNNKYRLNMASCGKKRK